MIKKNVTKIIVAVALTLAVIFGTGLAGEYMGFAMAPSAHAACMGGGTTGSGGGC